MPTEVPRKRRTAYAARQERFGWAMISPAMLFLFLMATFPLLALAAMSLFHVDLSMPFENGWAGLSNYLDMLKDARFWYSLWVTFLYTAVSVAIQIAFGLALGRLPADQYEAKFTEFHAALTSLAAEQKDA